MGSAHTKKQKNLKKSVGGIIFGIAFLLLGIAWILTAPSAFEEFLGFVLIIGALVHTAYYSVMFINSVMFIIRSRRKKKFITKR